MKLSIALTTYNHEKYIHQSLDSILNQEVNFEYEIVIGNDCSSDNTEQIITDYKKKFPNKIRNLHRDKNLGYIRNFDYTMRECLGEYIAIFDGDDIMLPGKLQKQVDYLDSNKDCVIVGHIARSFDSETNKTLRFVKPFQKQEKYSIEDLIKYGSFFANSSKMFRKTAYPPKGIDDNIKAIADWYVTLEIAKYGKIGFIHECLADYRVHNSSIMKTLNGNVHFQDKVYILNKLGSEYNGKYNHLFGRQMAYAFLIKGIFEYEQGDLKQSRKSFLKSISKDWTYSISPYYRLLLTFIPRKING